MASSSSSTSSSAAAHPINKSHQVFINHRGVDVKKNFAKSLYRRLREEGLTAFIDDEEMQPGYDISSQLEDVIKNARVHVAIFSPRYAESEWCLDELLLMLKSGAPIIPIFYGVSPATVRWNTKGLYGEALQTHEKKGRHDASTIQAWRNALRQVANKSGFELEEYNNQDLVLELLDNVVKRLLEMVPKEDLHGAEYLEMVPKEDLYVAEYPTGLDHKLTDFEETVLLKQQQSGKPQILGIVGLGGVGKTTLAKAFFNKKKSEYDRFCFLCDVREHATNRSLNLLQSQLRNSLIGFNKQVNSMDKGTGMLIEPLKSCKALIILDDVDDVNQVKAFLPQSDGLNSGTLLLITSRDKNVLRSLKVENSSIYSLSGLNKEDSLKLFCFHAFSQPVPLPEFRSDLVYKFVNYCNGLPLLLKEYGTFLYGKEISQWEDEWESRGQIVPSAIQKTFKISYDSLNQEEKYIFLDIACFFLYQNRDAAIRIWNALGWKGNRGLLNLQDKSLVEEADAGSILMMHPHLRDMGIQGSILMMHPHLRDMGIQVAAASSPRRLCQRKDIIHSLSHLSYKITFHGIQMFYDDDVIGGIDTENAVLERSFRSLQILQMQGSLLEPILRKVKPPSLSMFVWLRCPHSSLPSWVSVKNLRVLHLFGCELNTLWHWESESQARLQFLRLQFPVCLEELLVCYCEKLKSIRWWAQAQAQAQATKLKLLDVSGCSQLEKLSSMEALVSLENLKANRCEKLKSIRWSAQATKLRWLSVSDCSELEELPSMETLASLEVLEANGCKKLKGIRGSARGTKLKILKVSDCSEVEELPSMETLASLEELWANGCKKLKGIRGSAQGTKLKILDVFDSSELAELPSMETLASLEVLRADRCKKLKDIRGSAQATKLRVLDVSDCSELEELPSMETLASLEHLCADRCKKLKGIRGSAQPTKLEILNVSDCSELEELPSMETLASLEVLQANGCVKLRSIWGLTQATNLRRLIVSKCFELEVMEGVEHCTWLERLDVSECHKLVCPVWE